MVFLGMRISTFLNGCLGFAMLIALLFCMLSDIQQTINAETSYPYISIYAYVVGSHSDATAVVNL